jgi:hypothetical protein
MPRPPHISDDIYRWASQSCSAGKLSFSSADLAGSYYLRAARSHPGSGRAKTTARRLGLTKEGEDLSCRVAPRGTDQ